MKLIFNSLAIFAILLNFGCKKGETLSTATIQNFINMKNSALSHAGSLDVFSLEKSPTNEGGKWVVLRKTTSAGGISYYAYNLATYNNESVNATYEANVTTNWNGAWFTVATPDGAGNFNGAYHGANMINGTYTIMTPTELASYSFSEDGAISKDLERIGNQFETMEADQLANKMIMEYGLSEERGHEVAKIVQNYKKITTKRSLTEKENDQFSRSLLGVDYKSAKAALEGTLNGDESYSDLMEKAARTNGVSAEQVGEIISNLVFEI